MIGGDCELFVADVTHGPVWSDIAQTIISIDLLINNAGVNGPVEPDGTAPAQDFGSLDFDAWRIVLETNLIGQTRVTEGLLPALRAANGKQVLFVSSLLGSIERAGQDKLFYRTSKAALNMAGAVVCQSLANEGFRVGAVCPGWVRTRMGGEHATLSAETAADKALQNLDRIKPGVFVLLDENGKAIPW